MTPEDAVKKFADILSEAEKFELQRHAFVYYCGQNAKNQQKRTNMGQERNGGYDDVEGYYHAVLGDHVMYRYEILDSLGVGACGQVIKAMDHKHNLPVAIKLVRNIPLFKELAQQEIAIGKKLTKVDKSNNYCIVHMLDSFMFREHPCLVFEMLGLNLFDLMRSNKFKGLSEDFAKDFAKEMLQSLDILLRNRIIHCDIKPQNVMIFGPNCACTDLLSHKKFGEFVEAAHDFDKTSNHEKLEPDETITPQVDCPTNAIENLIERGGHHLKLIDFGCSVISGKNRYQYVQSRYYRAPEVILGAKYSCPVDMWSFGCVVAELILGHPLFPGESEIDQLTLIMEYLGPPPVNLMMEAKRKKIFFGTTKNNLTVDDEARYAREKSPSGSPREKPGSKSFKDTFGRGVSKEFIDFLTKCLEWDPDKRLTPKAALKHPWIVGVAEPVMRKRSTTICH